MSPLADDERSRASDLSCIFQLPSPKSLLRCFHTLHEGCEAISCILESSYVTEDAHKEGIVEPLSVVAVADK